MKCAIKSDSGSTSTASLSTTLTVEKDESEIMNPKILCAVRAGDKESLVKRIKDDAKTIQRLVDNHGNSLLHIAAASGHGNIVDY
ncbi:BnaCnng33600D [Brassica napus]|nr:BnaCnng33600D [Brassica napus]